MRHNPHSRVDRIVRMLIRLFPVEFRADHGREMEQVFRAQRREAWQEGRDGRGGTMGTFVRLWYETLRDVVATAPREHLAVLRQDVAYALRALRRTPVFAGAAILTLALGIGATAGIFTIINAFLFRPLRVSHPEQLISLATLDHHIELPHGLSFRDLQDYRTQTSVFSDLLGYTMVPVALNAGGGAERVTLDAVTDNYFSLLGVPPALGRLIQPGEGRARGDASVLVLAYDYWQSRFGADWSVVGRSVRLNGRPFTVIGVAASTFDGTEALGRVAGYTPLWMFDDLAHTSDAPASILERRDDHALTVIGRLKPGVPLAQARAAMGTAAAALARQYPTTNKDVSLFMVPETQARPEPTTGPWFHIAAAAFAGLTGLLLLITSANVANLLMARAAVRGREVAIRSALGARRGRLVRQLLTESIVLAVMGSAVAVPMVILVTRALERAIGGITAVVTLRPDFHVDWRVLAVTLGVAIGAGIVSGLAPAIYAFRTDLNALLKTGGRDASRSESRGRLRSILVVGQVAVSLALLVTGGLFLRSLDRARQLDLGFEPKGLLMATAAPSMQGYDAQQRLAFYRNARDRVAALPGVTAAAWTSSPQFSAPVEPLSVSLLGKTPIAEGQSQSAFGARVSPEYFTTARIPLLAGRSFDAGDDRNSAPVAIVNHTLATHLWPDENPIGHQLELGQKGSVKVVGVVKDGKYLFLWEPPRRMLFRPIAQDVPTTATLDVRTEGGVSDLATVVQQTIRGVDPDVPLYGTRTVVEHLEYGNAFLGFRLGALITGLLGGMGVLLASIGLYGMIAYHVSQRTHEIGVRMALGARTADILREMLARGARFALAGIAIGVLLALALTRLLRTLLLDVSPFDPVTYGSVASLLVVICLVASLIPAWRATAVDPLEALRAE